MAIKIFTVHERPADGDRPKDVVLVREGFSFWALLFQFVWALYHRLWLVAALFLGFGILGEALSRALGLPPGGQFVISVAIAVLIGTEANNLRRWTLARRGYEEVAVVAGHSLDEAEVHYFKDGAGYETGLGAAL